MRVCRWQLRTIAGALCTIQRMGAAAMWWCYLLHSSTPPCCPRFRVHRLLGRVCLGSHFQPEAFTSLADTLGMMAAGLWIPPLFLSRCRSSEKLNLVPNYFRAWRRVLLSGKTKPTPAEAVTSTTLRRKPHGPHPMQQSAPHRWQRPWQKLFITQAFSSLAFSPCVTNICYVSNMINYSWACSTSHLTVNVEWNK